MRILFLGNEDSPLVSFLRESGETVTTLTEAVTLEKVTILDPNFIISYNYRHIIKTDVLDRYDGRAINLHIAYLPWNRGADPNFWSFVEDTPKGVTIHYIDAGIDTGDIIAQEKVTIAESETLASSYMLLHEHIQALFKSFWPLIKTGNAPRVPQRPGDGTMHYSRDRKQFEHLLGKDGWNTLVKKLMAEKIDCPHKK